MSKPNESPTSGIPRDDSDPTPNVLEDTVVKALIAELSRPYDGPRADRPDRSLADFVEYLDAVLLPIQEIKSRKEQAREAGKTMRSRKVGETIRKAYAYLEKL